MDPERVGKMTFLRLSPNLIKVVVKHVNAGMACIRKGQEEARGQASKAQQKGVGEVMVLDCRACSPCTGSFVVPRA